ncbi:hypothetical protein HYU16_04530 [Candidatus Woesearchaeota archaeon]|nr:hypothetical protein [Candidatus Woesearchaeota archaeon]
MQRSFFTYYFLFLLLAAATVAINASQNANAAGFGVSPSNMEFIVEKGSQASRQLMLYNTNEEAAEFTAMSSNPETTKVSPERGTVPGEGTTSITVTARGIKKNKEGKSEGEIVISFDNRNIDADREVSLSLGTAVAVKVDVVKGAALAVNAIIGVIVSASIVMAGLAAYYATRRRAGKPSTDFHSAYDLYMARR